MREQCPESILELQSIDCHARIVSPLGLDEFVHLPEDAAHQHKENPLHQKAVLPVSRLNMAFFLLLSDVRS